MSEDERAAIFAYKERLKAKVRPVYEVFDRAIELSTSESKANILIEKRMIYKQFLTLIDATN